MQHVATSARPGRTCRWHSVQSLLCPWLPVQTSCVDQPRATKQPLNQRTRARYLAENPLRHDPLAVLAVDGVAEEGLDLLVVESLNISTTQKGVVGGDGACAMMWASDWR